MQIANRLEGQGYINKTHLPWFLIQSREADFGFLTAISFSTGTLAKMGCSLYKSVQVIGLPLQERILANIIDLIFILINQLMFIELSKTQPINNFIKKMN